MSSFGNNYDQQYRQMELNPQVGDGAAHSPELVAIKADEARRQVAFHEHQRAQAEKAQREFEEITEQKALFSANLNEVGSSVHNAIRRLEREVASMERETGELRAARDCFKQHILVLSSLQPKDWSSEGLQERLREALPKIDTAENDLSEFYDMGRKMQHTDIFRYRPGSADDNKLSPRKLCREFARGLAFHLPLFVLLLLTWGVYMLCTHTTP